MAVQAFVEAFATLLRNDPQAPVLVCSDGTTTRAALHERALQLAAELAAVVPEGSLVGLVAENGPGFLAGLLATAHAGLATLLVDPTLPAEGIAQLARRFGLDAWLRPDQADPVQRLAGGAARLPAGSVLKLTSGSTGQPRGVLTPARAIVDDCLRLATTMRLKPADRLLAGVPMSFSYGLSSLAAPALVLGTPLVVPRAGSPFNLLIAGERAQATFLPTTPRFLQGMLAHATLRLPASVRTVVSAGAALAPEHAAQFRTRFGRAVQVFYGASECGGITFDRDGGAAERGTVGTPVDGVDVRIERGGRIAVRSAAVATTYWPVAEPELADGRFLAGDLGSFAGSELRLLGRASEVVQVAGRKVHPREIELALLECPGVEDAVVLAEPDSSRGARWRAFVASRCGADVSTVQVFCQQRLAPHMRPASIVVLAAIPRTTRGKVDRARLTAAELPAQR